VAIEADVTLRAIAVVHGPRRQHHQSAEFKDVELAVGQPRTIDARLQVGSAAESVEVKATLKTLNRTSAEVGGLIEAEQIKEIPVSGTGGCFAAKTRSGRHRGNPGSLYHRRGGIRNRAVQRDIVDLRCQRQSEEKESYETFHK
jgi:hypothetical protein